MVEVEMTRHLDGLLLLDASLSEIETERAHAYLLARQPGGHAGRIEASRKKEPDFRFAVESSGHRFPGQRSHRAHRFLLNFEPRIDRFHEREVLLELELFP